MLVRMFSNVMFIDLKLKENKKMTKEKGKKRVFLKKRGKRIDKRK